MRVGRGLSYVVLLAGAAIIISPFAWMILTAIKTPREIFDLAILPKHPTLANFAKVMLDTNFLRWFGVSFVVAGLSTLSVLFFDSLVGYTLARLRFPGKSVIFVIILSTLMVPTEMLVIPWYVLSARLGWIDTYWGLLFPSIVSAFGVFLMRQFFATLPQDLVDASRIDGVSEFGIFWRIGLPLVRPALAALGIFTFLTSWNSFLWPLIIIQRPQMRTIPVGVALFSGEAGSSWHLIMAASTLSVIPVLVVFLFFQRQIIEGVVLTGMKG